MCGRDWPARTPPRRTAKHDVLLHLKALHIGFVVAWFAGLFYLPGTCVNLAMVDEGATRERLLLLAEFAGGRGRRGHVWSRFFSEFPVLLLFATAYLAVIKPWSG